MDGAGGIRNEQALSSKTGRDIDGMCELELGSLGQMRHIGGPQLNT